MKETIKCIYKWHFKGWRISKTAGGLFWADLVKADGCIGNCYLGRLDEEND